RGPGRLARLRAAAPRRPLRWLIVLATIAGALAIAYFAWFRDSSLVAVHDVKVEGVSSSDKGLIVKDLTHAARQMTTLHVQTDRLLGSVKGAPSVESVTADPSFPHGLTIHVTERPPVLVAVKGDRRVPVASDGSVLPGIKVGSALPALKVDSVPRSGRLAGAALAEALAIGAAPAPLRPLIEGASRSSDYGVVVDLRDGIELRFGGASGLDAKWAAVAAILADPQVTALTYIDARVPDRPAVGGTSTPTPVTTPVTPTTTTPATVP
ncbi:MAG: cell division protein FtsQ/DivIB, partial [Solirubrobacterales bacterium]